MDIALKDIPLEGLELEVDPSMDGIREVLAELCLPPEAGGSAEGAAPRLGGSLHVLPIGGSNGYYIQGRLEGHLVQACARCLGPAHVPLRESFEFQLFPRVSVDAGGGGKDISSGSDTPWAGAKTKGQGDKQGKKKPQGKKKRGDDDDGVELDSASLDVSFYDGDSVVLEELIREQLILTMDDTALCKEDCKGLCQGCGAELNTEPCTCDGEAVDPRFAVLKGLKLPN